ncbi:MAG: Unknown protein [uncultured Thiotrichaceae bacterium]|uniref:SWIM-type domain-containing protein n=1 Tax=uncultured Thiotrichaceae bacterium TaxID=298394 RepID=A0A6S6UCL1_9GAMM|nr:MAG: Unknown protein [uncultured Thiotrichaceae bacterium]
MAKITRTWWGESFLDVLGTIMDDGRLRRGRAYAGPNRLLEFSIKDTSVKAKIRGNKNPYFGVYKEPRYKTEFKLKQFSAKEWDGLTEEITRNAACLSQLLMNEMPKGIEAVFARQKLNLLPRNKADLVTKCSCPDYADPCKHVAGVYYKVASLLDRDPLLLFQLRGMDALKLQEKLAASPLGKALIDQWGEGEQVVEYQAHRYPEPPVKVAAVSDLKTFWQGEQALPLVGHFSGQPAAAAVLIKKGGDYPAFWQRDQSFIEVMEKLYPRIVDKNKAQL